MSLLHARNTTYFYGQTPTTQDIGNLLARVSKADELPIQAIVKYNYLQRLVLLFGPECSKEASRHLQHHQLLQGQISLSRWDDPVGEVDLASNLAGLCRICPCIHPSRHASFSGICSPPSLSLCPLTALFLSYRISLPQTLRLFRTLPHYAP